jgi:hypothetical protein
MARQHEVPTHLNVEDKVVFGLTVRQFLYMLVGSSATYSMWDQSTALPAALRVGLAVACVSLTLAFALLRLANRPLEEWLAAGMVYLASARRSTWQPREPDPVNWRAANVSWQELVPSLSWAQEEAE